MTDSRLEKLVMKGFKSFSKQTALMFSPGITAIVGPNGSGKSNILDALSFVMGSLSFNSLRAKSAENLLHFGKTKKATEAEVTLLIQVPKEVSEDGTLKLGRDLKNDGTSVYRVNTQRSTRLNTLDSLSAINIYPDSHNIVRQGDIVRFVNMSPRERRELVEIVAGIEMYEKKKQKALTDLAEVETKTQKVDAVHAERMRIFDKLKDEKHRVERFHQLKNLEERARFSLTVKRISGLEEKSRGLAKQKSEKEEKITGTEKELDVKAGELSRLSGELEEKGMKKKVGAMMKLESLKMNYRRKEEEKNNVLREIENTRSRMASISSQIEGLKRRKTDILTAETEKSRRVEQVHGEIAEYKKHRDEMIGRVAKSKQEYERKKEEYLQLKEKKEKLVLSLKEITLEKNSLEKIVQELEKKVDADDKRRLVLEAEKKKFFEERKKSESRMVELESELKKKTGELSEARELEKKILYSSSLPQGARLLKSMGFSLLGEKVNNPKDVMPFVFSIVAPSEKIGEIRKAVDKGWAFVLPEGFDEEKLKSISKLGTAVGEITEYEFRNEEERNKELEKSQSRTKKLEKEMDSLRTEKSRIEAVISQEFDSYQTTLLEESAKQTRKEIKERKKTLEGLAEEIKKQENLLFGIGDIKEPTIPEERRLEELASKVMSLEAELMRLSSELKTNEDTLKNLIEPDIANYEKLLKELREEAEEKQKSLDSEKGDDKKILKEIESVEKEVNAIEENLKEDMTRRGALEKLIQDSSSLLYQLRADITILEEKIRNVAEEVNSLRLSIREKFQEVENPEEILGEVLKELELLGDLNFKASDEFEEISKLVWEITEKLGKLKEEKDAILQMMEEIDSQKRKVFMDTFEKISKNFAKIFSKIIDGESRLELDGENPFDSGVHIKTIVNNREMPSESLSGGQKTLAAIALIFAIQEVKPSPFYIFDEVEAALDKPNSEKFSRMLKQMSEKTQIIIITHNDIVVKDSDQIIGVYMSPTGSRMVSLPKEKVLKEADSWIGSKNEEAIGPQ